MRGEREREGNRGREEDERGREGEREKGEEEEIGGIEGSEKLEEK